jgi:DNA-binding MarR family transcriptional regulator
MMDRNQDRGIAERTASGTTRADLPLLIDHAAIALESVRTQWRTIGDLGTHERMAVSQLRIYGAMPMSELASRISLSRAAVTSLVDRLETDGWVRRDPDDLDRRRTVLRLQPSAAQRWDSVVAEFNTDLGRLTNDMSDDELSAVTNFLKRLAALSERHAGELRASAVERSLQ